MTENSQAFIPRLKSLELHGYKTFASKTPFEFPGIITAIVGPNGSGKSNIADSLRWVLGEQSYSLLRGRKTEDMIFGGSEQRPRAGMASATIMFDNTDGWLPIDFSEVALTRRAYRDGQNEYLLNGQRVRLKEISELLAQSGLAERTYTIIGQGLVDAALSLKPEERRRFFEEAAGIGLYRSRREESLNRLENTRRNLERVQDILAELEPRLHSLEKQARRVIEYDRIKADLRVLLRDWYGYHWHKVQVDLAHSREINHAQEERQAQTRQRLEDVEHKLEIQRQAVSKNRTQLNTLHAQSAELHIQWEKVNRELAVMDERRRSNQDQILSLRSDLGRLEEERKGLDEKTVALQAEMAHLTQELVDAKEQSTAAQTNFQTRMKEREKIDQALRDNRRSLIHTETRQVQLRAHQTELASRSETLETTIQKLRAGLAHEAQVLSDARIRLEQTNARRSQLERDQRDLEEKISDHRKKIQTGESMRRQTQDTLSGLEAERTRLKAQVDVLEQAEKSFSGLNQGARYLLQAANQGKLGGKIKALSGLLQVPAQFETAIAAVLGEYLDGIILENPLQIDEALELLEGGEKGRAVIFSNLHPDSEIGASILEDAEFIGVAAGLLEVPTELRPLAQKLLGRTLVVRTRAAAQRLVSELAENTRLVTLKGEVFYPGGVVLAGQDGRAGIIGRPRQKMELKDRLAGLAQKISETEKNIVEIEGVLEKDRETGQLLEKQLRQANQGLSAAVQQVQQANLTVDQSRQRHEWQINQVDINQKQLMKTKDETSSLQVEITNLDAQVKALNEGIRDQNRILSGLPVDELQKQMSYWSTGAAVADRAVKEAQRRYDEHHRVILSNQQQLTTYNERLEGLQATLVELEARKASLQASETEIQRKIEILQLEINPIDQELLKLEEQYTSLQAEQSAAQQAALTADRYATQSQLDLGRVQDTMNSLRRRIEDDFGLVAFEYNSDVMGQTPLPLDGMVEQLPTLTEISADIDEQINRQRAQMRRMGAINPEAHKEFLEIKQRFEFMTQQVEDLRKADADLRQVIAELDELMRREFRKTFDAVAAEFKIMFTRLFGGGSAKLVLVDEDQPNETGIDIEARLPGRREQGLSLLSGGERSLTAVALIFSLLKISPTPFCVMDEVDAMLDESNVGRFCELLKELSLKTQFIVITHNRNTVQAADVIYGVTMGRDSASQVISLRLDEVSEEMVR